MEGNAVLGAAGTAGQAGMGHGRPALAAGIGQKEGAEFSTVTACAQDFSALATIGR
jgi:hypothetical protein